MPERAEIEALRSEIEGVLGVSTSHEQAREILDRVRDARGGDECREGRHEWAVSGDPTTTCIRCGVSWAARSPQAEDHENCPDCWGGRPKWAGTMPAPPCPTCGGTGKIPWSPERR